MGVAGIKGRGGAFLAGVLAVVAVQVAAPWAWAAAAAALAWVNGAPIEAARVQQVGERKGVPNTPLTMEQKQEALRMVIEDELLYQEALRVGLDKDPKVKKLMANLLLRAEVYDHVKVTDFTEAQLRAYFEAHPEAFVVPEKVQVRRILIAEEGRTSAEAEAIARDLYKQLRKDPSSFAAVAKARSEDAYRRRGGDLGFLSAEGKLGVDPEIVARAMAMEEGELAKPFHTKEGWNVVMVAARRPAVARSYEQMKGSVLRRVKDEAMKARYDAYVQGLREKAEIRVDDVGLRALEIVPKPPPPPPEEGEGPMERGPQERDPMERDPMERGPQERE